MLVHLLVCCNLLNVSLTFTDSPRNLVFCLSTSINTHDIVVGLAAHWKWTLPSLCILEIWPCAKIGPVQEIPKKVDTLLFCKCKTL